jgi:hypothetical protein
VETLLAFGHAVVHAHPESCELDAARLLVVHRWALGRGILEQKL